MQGIPLTALRNSWVNPQFGDVLSHVWGVFTGFLRYVYVHSIETEVEQHEKGHRTDGGFALYRSTLNAFPGLAILLSRFQRLYQSETER